MITLLKTTPARVAGAVFAAAIFAAAQAAVARPGTVNYAEGQVTVDGREVGAKNLGQTEVAPGQVLQTEQGKAEMLLTPGVFLRMGDRSAVRMVSPSLTDTRVEVLHGRALVEVDDVEKENRLDIVDNGIRTRLEKRGIYAFNADQPSVAVYDGKAVVQDDDRTIEVKKGKQLPLESGTAKLKPQKFDRNETDDLYAWSKLRSGYLAEANASSAETIVVSNPAWYLGTGWYWNPWYSTWAFVPGGGFLYSPFGYGFYSPAYWFYNPPIYAYRNYPRVGRFPSRVGGIHRAFPGRAAPAFRSPAMRSAPAAGGSGLRFGGGAGGHRR